MLPLPPKLPLGSRSSTRTWATAVALIAPTMALLTAHLTRRSLTAPHFVEASFSATRIAEMRVEPWVLIRIEYGPYRPSYLGIWPSPDWGVDRKGQVVTSIDRSHCGWNEQSTVTTATVGRFALS
jgi:hypothetical protein